MSTDLHFLHLQTLTLPSSDSITQPARTDNHREDEGSGSSSESCRTPTSKKHRIPAVLCCPPAPKKPKFSRSSCKRKLSELEFFDIVNRREVDTFFEMAAASATAAGVSKRRRPLVE